MPPIVRAEAPDDEGAIRALTNAAFAGVAHAGGTEAAIVDALRAAGALTVSLVAEGGGAIVGHIASSPIAIDGIDRNWFGLGPVSVLPRCQRRGIGTALIEAALAKLRAAGAAGCVLLGDPAYYARFGFARDAALTYADAPARYFQCLILAGPRARGEVRYHPAFAAT